MHQFHHCNAELCSSPSVSPSQPPRQVWCRLVTAAYNYFHVTNFFWMFGEGCYLHTAIVLTYSTDKLRKWMFICIGWCKYQDFSFTLWVPRVLVVGDSHLHPLLQLFLHSNRCKKAARSRRMGFAGPYHLTGWFAPGEKIPVTA